MKRKMASGVHGVGGGLGSSAKEAWVSRATGALLDLLDEELALVPPEIEARLHLEGLPISGHKDLHLDPHILTEALQQLQVHGLCESKQHRTRAGRSVDVYVTTRSKGRTTAIGKRVARKALLYGRYIALSRTAGEAGELVVRHSLMAARAKGLPYQPVTPAFGEVRQLLGHTTYGPLDSGAWLHRINSDGVPLLPIAVPVEVKNRRLVLYPTHKEVHQLLSKAASLQLAQTDYPIAPVLICRRAHSRLFWMASDLGFRVWQTNEQYVFASRDIDERKINELKHELRLTDLRVVNRSSPPTIVKFFQEIFPGAGRGAASSAARSWAFNARHVAPYAARLRTDDIAPADRQLEISDLHQDVGAERSWAFSMDDEMEYDAIPHHDD